MRPIYERLGIIPQLNLVAEESAKGWPRKAAPAGLWLIQRLIVPKVKRGTSGGHHLSSLHAPPSSGCAHPPKESEGRKSYMRNSEQHRQVGQSLPDAKAAGLTAIGQVAVEAGPSLAVSDCDGPNRRESGPGSALPFGFSIVQMPAKTTALAC